MRVFLDSNILLDVSLEREPFVNDSEEVMNWCQENASETSIAWHTITNVYYILNTSKFGDEKARMFLLGLLSWATIAPTGLASARSALESKGGDLEDKLQSVCALAAGSEVIVTRNLKDFTGSPVRAVSPAQFLTEVSG